MRTSLRTYLFWVTLKVWHNGEPLETEVFRGVRADNELDARRMILYSFIDEGFQVKRIVLEQSPPECAGIDME